MGSHAYTPRPVLTVEKYCEITALVPEAPERYTGMTGSAGRAMPRLGLSAAIAGSDHVAMAPCNGWMWIRMGERVRGVMRDDWPGAGWQVQLAGLTKGGEGGGAGRRAGWLTLNIFVMVQAERLSFWDARIDDGTLTNTAMGATCRGIWTTCVCVCKGRWLYLSAQPALVLESECSINPRGP